MSKGEDIAEISELVARERLFRARHNPEIADCYYPDATVATSWQQGPLSTFIGSDSKEVEILDLLLSEILARLLFT